MFPNPHDALPLPPRPNLEQYKKLAKDLLKASQSPDPADLRTWCTRWIEKISLIPSEGAVSQSDKAPQSRAWPEPAEGDLVSGAKNEISLRIAHWTDQLEKFARKELPQTMWGGTHSSVPPSAARQSGTATLTSAQFVIARAHGFESWPKLAKHLEALPRANSPVSHFERAADAIVAGDAAGLEKMLREHPDLIRATSARRHQATLLHYISANGIEDYRQKTPNTIVQIANLLLGTRADVNAVANVYGGSTTLGLVATSIHPERAGVQETLLQLLLDHGATIDPANSPAGPLINICLANGRVQAAEFLAQRGARLDLEGAAGLGRLDVVKSYFDDSGALRPSATQIQMERAFLWACEYGRVPVVDFLLQREVPLQTEANTGQTALHWAVIGGQLDTIKLLLERGASHEAKNVYGGTPLDQALWSAAHGDRKIDYTQIADVLRSQGAKE
jgi:Ankyrin repeats (3 copies)